MPCYTKWNAYLVPNSSEYKRALADLEAKFKAVKHVIDYYLKVNSLPLPNARYCGWGSQYELIEVNRDYTKVISEISRHLSCDGVTQDVLLDIESILCRETPKGLCYAYLTVACHLEMRTHRVACIDLSKEDSEVDSSWFKATD